MKKKRIGDKEERKKSGRIKEEEGMKKGRI